MNYAALQALVNRLRELTNDRLGMSAKEIRNQVQMLDIPDDSEHETTSLMNRAVLMSCDTQLTDADQQVMRRTVLALKAMEISELAGQACWIEVQTVAAEAIVWDKPEWRGSNQTPLPECLLEMVRHLRDWRRTTCLEAIEALS